ncbi:hypothetical protein NE237_008669 [Protea cynaroides]|uniref:50S ribosomal protein L18 n=1 Tax=Protea cynaroides TaxID=273540 RepID=A0A9Q0KX61_9MAGN|nr:hypothetical protein NE237_008669 [Protea cynaroides]
MPVTKRYLLQMFMTLKHITATVVDRNNCDIVATASTVERAFKNAMEYGRSGNAKVASVVGEVLARRLKLKGLDEGQGSVIHADVRKEIEKKGLKNQTKVWAIVDALKNNGVKIIIDDNNDDVKGVKRPF